MKTAFQIILLSCLTFIASYLITDAVLGPNVVTFFVEDEYDDSFAATCAVVDSSDVTFKFGGTGILLNNGRILTAKHVPDTNRNGIIDDNEKDVLLKFYYPKEFTCIGRIIYAPPEKNVIAKGYDFIIIKPSIPMRSNIKLQSLRNHYFMGAGKQIYTIGRKDAEIPTIVFGNHTTRLQGDYFHDRAHLDIWNGNSGGGVFRKDTGELIGIVSLKRTAQGWGGPIVWSGYIGAYDIRSYLRPRGLEKLIRHYSDAPDYKAQQTRLYSFILLNCFLGVYFGHPVLCEEMWDMRGVNAAL